MKTNEEEGLIPQSVHVKAYAIDMYSHICRHEIVRDNKVMHTRAVYRSRRLCLSHAISEGLCHDTVVAQAQRLPAVWDMDLS